MTERSIHIVPSDGCNIHVVTQEDGTAEITLDGSVFQSDRAYFSMLSNTERALIRKALRRPKCTEQE